MPSLELEKDFIAIYQNISAVDTPCAAPLVSISDPEVCAEVFLRFANAAEMALQRS